MGAVCLYIETRKKRKFRPISHFYCHSMYSDACLDLKDDGEMYVENSVTSKGGKGKGKGKLQRKKKGKNQNKGKGKGVPVKPAEAKPADSMVFQKCDPSRKSQIFQVSDFVFMLFCWLASICCILLSLQPLLFCILVAKSVSE